ncbi:hypothetical protein [Paenibacillus caseinilyticus]|uniref:hypothetical protein n=2 Tax=Paenibacillus TaxID=44249 RepID=UPI0022B90ADA|nr:hypothetical protein [Paenibacillus caseinilyticus]MCZ8519213.1 hypothetical protein [Paenibacillus caseinilyticus]
MGPACREDERGMPIDEKQEPVTDTLLEDYEEYLDDDDDRWRPGGLHGACRDRNAALRRRRLM